MNYIISFVFYCASFFLFAVCLHAQQVKNGSWEKLVPSDNIPKDLKLKKANNNLDVVEFNDRYYLAFRNASNHFASRNARLIVLSSSDLRTWEFEKEIHLNNDLREPRFAVYKEQLFLYFFQGGHRFYKFEPQHVYYCTYSNEEGWTDHINAQLDGYVPWRIIQHKGLLYLSAYYGANLYSHDKEVELRLFVSNDGSNWEPISEMPQLTHNRAVSEGEFLFDQNGMLWGVARLEFDGSYTYKADPSDISNWKYVYSPFKFDSSLMFENNENIFLIARRNLDGDGSFVQKKGKPNNNLIRYSMTRKTTALFRLNKEKLKWDHIKDFQSTGDNSFPGLIKLADGEYILFNYSSDINKRKKNWICGQLGKTFIYTTLLTIIN